MDQSPGFFPPPPEPESAGPFSAPPASYSAYGYGFYPLDLGRVLSLTWSMFRFQWPTFVGIGAITALPGIAITALVSTATTARMIEWQESITLAMFNRPASFDPLAAFPWDVMLWTFVAGLVAGILSYLGSAAIVHAAYSAYTGRSANFGSAIRFAAGNVVRILGLYVLIALLVGVFPWLASVLPAMLLLGMGFAGFVLVPILAIAIAIVVLFVLLRVQLALQVLVAEDVGPTAALGRSWRLMKGSMWRMLGYLLLFGLIIGFAAAIAGGVAIIVSPPSLAGGFPPYDPASLIAQAVLGGLITAALTPLMLIAQTVLYFDIRWRRGEPSPVPGATAVADR